MGGINGPPHATGVAAERVTSKGNRESLSPRILGCGSVVFTVVVGHLNGHSAGGGRCGGAGCTASIAFRAVTILLYSSTGVGCIRSGSIRISGTQIGPPRSVIALFCCPALAIADCRSAGPQLERGRRADPLRQMHPRRAAATRVGRPGHHRGQPITPLTIPDAFPPDHSGRGPDDHRMPSDADRLPPTVDPNNVFTRAVRRRTDVSTRQCQLTVESNEERSPPSFIASEPCRHYTHFAPARLTGKRGPV